MVLISKAKLKSVETSRDGGVLFQVEGGGLSAESMISEREMRETSRRVMGHAPPENFEI